jgi:MFS family permease
LLYPICLNFFIDAAINMTSSTEPASLFSNLNFKYLWSGAVITSIGDQLSLVAIPWLILNLTGDPLQVGLVLSIMSVPRAFFILYGGVLTDQFHPLRILTYSRFVSFGLTMTLLICLYAGWLNVTILTLIAFGLGLSSALATPAMMSILPRILHSNQLKSGNSLMMMNIQLSAIIGPALAGYLLSQTGAEITIDKLGYLWVFGIDALTFLLSALSLLWIQLPAASMAAPSIPSSFGSLLRGSYTYLRQDTTLAAYLSYVAAISFFIVGPSTVGLPILVKMHLQASADWLGLYMTTQGLGVAIGIALAIVLPSIGSMRLGMLLLGLDALAGLLVLVFVACAQAKVDLAVGCIPLLLIGMIGGYIQVVVFVWIQKKVALAFMGRMMSILMFASLGLAPISSAMASWIIEAFSVTTLFEGMGCAMVSLACLGLCQPKLRRLGQADTLADSKP